MWQGHRKKSYNQKNTMAWRNVAPAAFKKAPPTISQQSGFLQNAAPVGSETRNLLDDYVNGGESLWFNNYLRGINMEGVSDRDKKEYKKKTSILNKLIHGAPVSKRKMVLFRAISDDTPKLQKYSRGDEADFLNRGIISTSTSYDAAMTFLEEGDPCCMLVILAPNGTHMLEVLENSVWSEESEVLLPHDSRFKVVKTSIVNGIETFYCILVV